VRLARANDLNKFLFELVVQFYRGLKQSNATAGGRSFSLIPASRRQLTALPELRSNLVPEITVRKIVQGCIRHARRRCHRILKGKICAAGNLERVRMAGDLLVCYRKIRVDPRNLLRYIAKVRRSPSSPGGYCIIHSKS